MENYSKSEILQMVEEEDVEFIRLQFTDMFGVLKNVAIPSIFSAHITEKTSNLPLLGSPWQNGKRAQIWFQIQITFFPTGKSIQGCGIDGTTVFHSFDQSAARDCHVF